MTPPSERTLPGPPAARPPAVGALAVALLAGWALPLGAAAPRDLDPHIGEKSSYRPTPAFPLSATGGDYQVTLDEKGRLTAMDRKTGKEQWYLKLASFPGAGEPSARSHDLLIHAGRVLVARGSRIMSIDLRRAEEVWSTMLGAAPCESVKMAVKDGELIVNAKVRGDRAKMDQTWAFDPRTGKKELRENPGR